LKEYSLPRCLTKWTYPTTVDISCPYDKGLLPEKVIFDAYSVSNIIVRVKSMFDQNDM